jgi:glucose-6-phosphate isomerase
MTDFLKAHASAKLSELASHPLDLTHSGALTRQRIDAMALRQGPLKLLYGTERVDAKTLEALFQLAEESGALKKMHEMQAGKVVNFITGHPSENRAALHTAMRDFSGKSEAAKLAMAEVEKLRRFLEKTGDQFTDIIQVGIGGSELGPKAIYNALYAYRQKGRRAHFLSNVDPDDGAQIFREVDLKKTLVVVVSKSGSTLETLTNETYVRERFQKAGLDPKHHVASVTGKGSPMDDPSHYCASFYMWDYVGGRYSVTSMVGGVMLAFTLGIDKFLEFLRGAHEIDLSTNSLSAHQNLPLLSALLSVWNRNFLNLPTAAIIPYAQALHRFPAHLQQLEMESNGKQIDKSGKRVAFETGPVIWGEPGTNGQHSFFQLIHQGTTPVPLEMIGFSHSQYGEDVSVQGTTSQQKLLSNMFAQALALAMGQKSDNPNKNFPGNRPSRILFANRLDPHTMGAIMAYYEHKTVFQGFIWNINSFDQEGVQLGKVLALKMISQFTKHPDDFPLGASLLRKAMIDE